MLDHRNDEAPVLMAAQRRPRQRHRVKPESPMANVQAVADLLGMHPDEVVRAVSTMKDDAWMSHFDPLGVARAVEAAKRRRGRL
jgi:hypothetical protein